MSAPECRCGKALETLRGNVAEALAALDEGRVDNASTMLRAAMADTKDAAPSAS